MEQVVLLAALQFPEVNMPSAGELSTLRHIMCILKPFYEATTEMAAEKTTTISKDSYNLSDLSGKNTNYPNCCVTD